MTTVSMTTLREQLIQIQRRNYRKNVALVRESLGPWPAIEKYEREYKRHLQDYEAIADKSELIRKVLASDIVYHGDYHTLMQSQVSILSILREIGGRREVILCLEMFHGRDQKDVDRFMAGELSERAFLKKIDYARKWPFRWSHWLPIINHCRDHGIPIQGINTEADDGKGIKNLRERDQYSARIVAKAFLRNPGKLVYLVDGDYHVSPNHLPKNVNALLNQLGEDAKTLIIFQNADNLYWKLCRQGLEESDVLKIRENIYCVMNTMPANKIQSYLNWLEYAEDAYFPVHRDWKEDVFELKGLTVYDIVQTLSDVLGLKLPSGALDKLTIHYPNDLDFIAYVHNTPQLKGQIRLIKDKIKRGEGFMLEYEKSSGAVYIIYLANSSINMAAEEACHFLHALLRGPLKKEVDHFDRFYRNVITECLGFFGSKFINEKRKAESENAIRRFLGRVKRDEIKGTDPEVVQVSRYILQHFYLQRKKADADEYLAKFRDQYKSRSAVSRLFSTQLGYMLGNRLYYAVKRGKFPLERVRELFCDPLDRSQAAFEAYLEINRRIKTVKHVPRM